MKIKQYISEQPMDQRRNQKEIKNILKQMKIQHAKSCGMQ